jgi:hypothetical protein
MRTSTARTLDSLPAPTVSLATLCEVVDTPYVSVSFAPGDAPRPACLAFAAPYEPRVGDRLLVAADDAGSLFVVGVVGGGPARELVSKGGARARLVSKPSDAAESLEVRDAEGRLLFEHRDGVSVVHAPRGDLELRADEGALRLSAAHGVVLASPEGVRLEAKGPAAGSIVTIAEDGFELASPRVRAAALHADVTVDEAQIAGRHAQASFASVLQVVGKLETRAERLVERARELYTEVEELAQTHAGRVRVVAREAFHLLGKRASLKTEKDLKLQAEKIHLG